MYKLPLSRLHSQMQAPTSQLRHRQADHCLPDSGSNLRCSNRCAGTQSCTRLHNGGDTPTSTEAAQRKEQAIYGRVFQRLDDVRAAVADFVERYNQSWRLEKLGYQTPIEAREAYELRPAA